MGKEKCIRENGKQQQQNGAEWYLIYWPCSRADFAPISVWIRILLFLWSRMRKMEAQSSKFLA